jgi:DNA repair protein RecO
MIKNRHFQTDGIILKVVTTGEINRLFYFISPQFGIQPATAFGAAKIKSRFCSSVQSFNQAKLFLYENPKNHFIKLEDISHVHSNDHINKHLPFIYLASFFCESLLETYISPEEYKKYYYLLKYSLELLDEKKNVLIPFLFYSSKFIFLSGYQYQLNFCNQCHQKKEQYFFDIKEGTIFCNNHKKSDQFQISSQTASIWNDFLEKKYIELKNYHLEFSVIKNLIPLITQIFNEMFEKELKTMQTFKYIFCL